MSKVKKVSKIFLYLIIFSYAVEGLVENSFASAWPSISQALRVEISFIGILTMIYYASSSMGCVLASDIRKRIGTNYSSILSLVLYILSLIIIAFTKDIVFIVVGVVIMGLGVGNTEVNTDSYVIKAYDAKWDSFLHAFWGVGSFAAPLLLSLSLHYTSSYKVSMIVVIAICIMTMLFFITCKSYWSLLKKNLPSDVIDLHSVTEEEKKFKISFFDLIKIKKVIAALLCFFIINGIVRAIIVILPTLLVAQKMLIPETAGFVFSFYFIAMCLGRIFFGVLTNVFKIKNIIKLCIALSIISFLLFHLDNNNYFYIVFCMIFMGFSNASLLPLMNSNLKDVFEIKYLSIILGYGEVVGLIGTSVLSFFLAIAMEFISMSFTQVIMIISLILLFIVYTIFSNENKSV
jgi:MFS family permease